MASLGFDFQLPQTDLVSALFSNLGGAIPNLNAIGFFTQSQLQPLNVNSPLLARDPNTGLFKLTTGVEKAAQLTSFVPFPMTAPQTTINAEGKLEFRFSAPDNAAFFRLEAW